MTQLSGDGQRLCYVVPFMQLPFEMGGGPQAGGESRKGVVLFVQRHSEFEGVRKDPTCFMSCSVRLCMQSSLKRMKIMKLMMLSSKAK